MGRSDRGGGGEGIQVDMWKEMMTTLKRIQSGRKKGGGNAPFLI